MRNLGGAIGIAVVNTWIGDFARTHTLRMSESMSDNPEHAGGLISGLTAYASRFTPDPAIALGQAQSQLVRIVGREAATLAFADVFRLMAWIFIVALVIVPFCKPAPTDAPPVSEH
jgi:DHA2 family multidrug resistance protein